MPTAGHRPQIWCCLPSPGGFKNNYFLSPCPAPWPLSYERIFMQKNNMFVFECVCMCTHINILTTLASTQVWHKLSRQQSRVSHLHKYNLGWIRPQMDLWNSRLQTLTSTHTRTPRSVLAGFQRWAQKRVRYMYYSKSLWHWDTQTNWQIGVSHVTVMNKTLSTWAIAYSFLRKFSSSFTELICVVSKKRVFVWRWTFVRCMAHGIDKCCIIRP